MRKMLQRIVCAAVAVTLLVTPSTSVFAKTKNNAKKRYIVTCNHNYDNEYNTLGKYSTVEKARAKIKKQKKAYRGQWYVYDKTTKKIVWPDLSTDKKKAKKAVSWVTAVGNDPRHGYTCEGERSTSGCDLKWPRWGKKGDYSCSTLVATAYELFGLFNARTYCWKHNLKIYAGGLGNVRGFSSRNFAEALRHSDKFKEITKQYRKKGKKYLQAGDIVITRPNLHTGMIISKGRIVEGAGNENGAEFQVSRPGDQRGGNELRVSRYNGGFYWVFRPKSLC